MRAVIASLLAVAVCSGCAGDAARAPEGVFFPTVPRQDAYPAALLTAGLEEHFGCLFAGLGEQRLLLLWPDGYSARRGQAGIIEVLNDDDDVIATTGREVSVGGGETNPTEVGGAAASDGWARELSGDQIPERCGSLYWLVSP